MGILSCAMGETRRVPQEYATIQAAFSAVAPNDTVLVSVGTYAEELTAPPLRFWLMGDVEVDTGDFERPTIDPSTLDSAQWRHCLAVPPGCELTIERMAFVNRASMFPRADPLLWGGILVFSEQPLTLRYCLLDSTWGGVFRMPFNQPCDFLAEDCHFRHGQRSQLIAGGHGRATAVRCHFDGRHCAFVFGHDGSRVEDCSFTGDSLYSSVRITGINLLIRNCVFGPIDSTVDAVLAVHNEDTALIEGCVFHDIGTRISVLGGLVHSGYVSHDPIVFRHNLLYGNSALGAGATTCLSIQRNNAVPEVSARLDTNVFYECHSPETLTFGKALSLEAPVHMSGNRFGNLLPDTVPWIGCDEFEDPVSVMRANLFRPHDYAITAPSVTVDARWNYWGNADGPYNPTYNPAGHGARVDDAVLFDPWCPDTNCFESAPDPSRVLHPSSFILSCYPNPFNSVLHLTLIPAEVGIVKVELFDVLGRRASELWHGPLAFQKDVTFDASSLASGIYFARVTDVISRKNLAMAKLMLLR